MTCQFICKSCHGGHVQIGHDCTIQSCMHIDIVAYNSFHAICKNNQNILTKIIYIADYNHKGTLHGIIM
jgi:accessory gene regulator protein AgrB